VLGKFGKAAKIAAEEWIDAGAVHFLASDAHNITSRPLRLREAFEHLEKTRGEEVAQALLVDNPLAVFEGRDLPFVPELDEDVGLAPGANSPRRRKRFWIF
jgi:protein-tyrosine phosphatase